MQICVATGVKSAIEARRFPSGQTEVSIMVSGYLVMQSFGTWRSLVAHPLWERGVVGSNPAVPTSVNLIEYCGFLRIEHETNNDNKRLLQSSYCDGA